MKNNIRILFLYCLFSCFTPVIIAQNSPSVEEFEQQLKLPNLPDTSRIDILLNLHKQYTYNLLVNDKALQSIEEAIAIARKLGNPEWLVKTLLPYATFAIRTDQQAKGAELLKEVIDLSRANNLPSWEVRALTSLGIMYSTLEAFAKAEFYLSTAYEKALLTKDKTLICRVQLNQGAVNAQLGNRGVAIAIYRRCLNQGINTLDGEMIAVLYQNLGAEYTRIKEFEKAKMALDSCQLIITQKQLSLSRQINLYFHFAELYFEGFNDMDKTIAYLNKIIAYAPSSLQSNSLINAQVLLAKAYNKKHNKQEALKYLLNAKETLSNSNQDLIANITVNQMLSETYAGLQNWQEAYVYAHQTISLNDSLQNQKVATSTAYSLISREIDSKEQELTEKNNQLKFQKRIYETVGMLAIPLLIILAAAIYFRMKLTRSKERLRLQEEYTEGLEHKVKERTQDLELAHKHIQEAKERENVSLALLNQRHIELLEHLTKKLQNWQEQDLVSDIKAVQPVLNDIRAAQAQAEEWGSFMLHFERIHPNFAQSLQKQYPDLTPNELKHCAYMRLNMTRKQVADTLHCSEDAVKLARTRIRKKVGLTADDSLQSFLDQWSAQG